MTFYYTIDAGTVRSYIPAVPVMLPASSWSRFKLRAPKLPPQITEKAADCGGFVATKVWGDYRYSPQQYVDWLETWQPNWAATMDYCCEDEITSGQKGIVRERQQKTTAMAQRFWRDYQDRPWTWVPTVQGWETDDYERHASELAPLVKEMADYYEGGAFRVGIGTLCRRASTQQIRNVVRAVSQVLPGVPLHLWGVKLQTLKDTTALPPGVTSVDSAAWNGLFGTDREEWKRSGLSQAQWVYRVALPRYQAKVERALSAPKQLSFL